MKDITVGDLIDDYPDTMDVLEDYGIDVFPETLEMTIGEACALKGVDADDVLDTILDAWEDDYEEDEEAVSYVDVHEPEEEGVDVVTFDASASHPWSKAPTRMWRPSRR